MKSEKEIRTKLKDIIKQSRNEKLKWVKETMPASLRQNCDKETAKLLQGIVLEVTDTTTCFWLKWVLEK